VLSCGVTTASTLPTSDSAALRTLGARGDRHRHPADAAALDLRAGELVQRFGVRFAEFQIRADAFHAGLDGEEEIEVPSYRRTV